ncbi:MAG: SIS domain-containing protein [Christensenellales bacterium]
MKVIGRDNNVMNGFLDYPAYAEGLLERLTDDAICQAIPDGVLRNIKRVVVTGNGDSYAATLATSEFNSRMFRNAAYHALRCIDVARHYVFPADRPEETLVVVISVSGSGSRATEAMKRATAKGCTTLAVTGNPESRMAKEANHILRIEVGQSQAFSPTLQTRTYFTAIITTLMFGLHAGLLLGAISPDAAAAQRREILRYVTSACHQDVLSRVDDQMFVLADRWKDYLGYGFVGGGSDFATASFAAAKFFELCGSLNCLNDSEDWCHIDYFQTNRNLLGTIAVASRNCASFSRTVETIRSMQKSDRNVLVITDTDRDCFVEGVDVCSMPAAEYDHMNPLMNFMPALMLGNYTAIKRGYEYFGGMDASNPLFSQEGGINTIKSSEIVYIE